MRLHVATGILLLLAPAAALAAPQQSPAQGGEGPAARPPSQVILEIGLAVPYGDLGDDFAAADLGFGAGNGMETGFRWRLHVSPTLSVSPAFHFTNYGNFSTSTEDLGDVRVDCTSYRYTVELLLRARARGSALRPFLAVAGGLYRNRVVGYTKEFTASFDESVNSFGMGLRVGIEVSDLEFSAGYNLNRFKTWRFFRTGAEQAYDWDSVVLRGAWKIPFGD